MDRRNFLRKSFLAGLFAALSGFINSVEGFFKAAILKRVLLQWQPPLNNGGSPLSGYNLYRDGSFYVALSPSALSYPDVLHHRGTFTYYVTALNAQGESNPSNKVSVTV